MTEMQWQTLLAVIRGETVTPIPVAFIIDSPWLPNWAGMTILDYYASDERWLEANLKALREFPECIFLPGFWSEFGMCAEPSAFGAKCLFYDNEFPFAERSSGPWRTSMISPCPIRAATACCLSLSSGCSTAGRASRRRGTRSGSRYRADR
jgi:hypothetical protein